MFKISFFENIRKACRQTIKEIKHGFHSQTLVDFCVETQREVQKATPRSDQAMYARLCAYYNRDKHTADSWDADLETNHYGGVIGFFINNTAKVEDKYIVDFLEYGTPPHWIDQPTKGVTWWHHGIPPMGFVRKVQDDMDKKAPKVVRQYFDRPITNIFR